MREGAAMAMGLGTLGGDELRQGLCGRHCLQFMHLCMSEGHKLAAVLAAALSDASRLLTAKHCLLQRQQLGRRSL